jgi:glutathione S-transferase
MITLHHLNNSRSQRVLWALEELGLPYEIVKYERDKVTSLAPPELRAVHPLGKSPVITDSDLPGAAIAESGAILEYLVDKAGGKLAPAPGTAAHRDYRYFLHYAEGSLMPFLLLRLVFGRMRTAKMPFFVKPIARKIADRVDGSFVDPNLKTHVAFCGDHLAKHAWFAGDELSMADIQMSFPMEAVGARYKGAPEAIGKYVATIQARPAYKRALERGGPYELMG